MALTRKFLKALGIEDDKVDEIINAHSETVTALKEQAEQYKADAEKLPTVQRKLDDAEEAARAAAEHGEKDPYKVKYDAIKEEYEAYKTENAAKATKTAKTNAYRELLKEAGVSEKRIAAVLKVSDVDSVELVDGKIKDADKLTTAIKTDWADFIPAPGTKGATVDNPPANAGGVDTSQMSDAEYFAYQREQKKG